MIFVPVNQRNGTACNIIAAHSIKSNHVYEYHINAAVCLGTPVPTYRSRDMPMAKQQRQPPSLFKLIQISPFFLTRAAVDEYRTVPAALEHAMPLMHIQLRCDRYRHVIPYRYLPHLHTRSNQPPTASPKKILSPEASKPRSGIPYLSYHMMGHRPDHPTLPPNSQACMQATRGGSRCNGKTTMLARPHGCRKGRLAVRCNGRIYSRYGRDAMPLRLFTHNRSGSPWILC